MTVILWSYRLTILVLYEHKFDWKTSIHQPHPCFVCPDISLHSWYRFQRIISNINITTLSHPSKQHWIRNKFLRFSTYTRYLTCPDNEKVSDLLQTRHHIAVNSSALQAHSDKPANPTELLNNQQRRRRKSANKQIVYERNSVQLTGFMYNY